MAIKILTSFTIDMTQTAQNSVTLALCKIHILLPSSQQCMYPASLQNHLIAVYPPTDKIPIVPY